MSHIDLQTESAEWFTMYKKQLEMSIDELQSEHIKVAKIVNDIQQLQYFNPMFFQNQTENDQIEQHDNHMHISKYCLPLEKLTNDDEQTYDFEMDMWDYKQTDMSTNRFYDLCAEYVDAKLRTSHNSITLRSVYEHFRTWATLMYPYDELPTPIEFANNIEYLIGINTIKMNGIVTYLIYDMDIYDD